MTKLLFIDTETGGLDPQQHSLLTAAFAVWEDGEIIDTLDVRFVHDVYNVTQRAMEVNKIDLRHHDGMYVTEARNEIMRFIEKHFGKLPATVVGQNVQFDVGFLKVLFGHMYVLFFSHRVIDTASLLRFADLTGVTKIGGSSLSDALSYFGILIKDEDRHTAMGDVIGTVTVFNQLLALHKGAGA